MDREKTMELAYKYAQKFTRDELVTMQSENPTNLFKINKKVVEIAINHHDGKYGRQLKINFGE